MSETYRQYVKDLEDKITGLYDISDAARGKGFDPSLKTECKIAKDLADLVEGLVGPPGVAVSIRELNRKLPREELAFKVAEEIVYGKFGHMEPEAAAEQAIRTALAIFTEGVTAAPLQGVARVSIKTNLDRTHYLAIYFAGPMRAAGGTDQALTLVVGDFVRRMLGLERYKPTEEETQRFIEEVRLYERSVTRFQYHVSDAELRKAIEWIPIEVTGTESDPIEVSSYRNLLRVETNRLRGGALRVVNDGIVGRAPKVLAIIEKLGFRGWDWLKETQGKSKKAAGLIDEVIAGRPVFSFPSRRGGFRLRYGRARNTGLSAVGIHPATMLVLQGFLAGGTQLRLELPGKGGIVLPVDTLEPPLVRLNNGTVIVASVENFDDIKKSIDRILFLGDILISFGDFLYNSKSLVPSGYVEEWWSEDLRQALADRCGGRLEKIAHAVKISADKLRGFLKDPFALKPSIAEAISLSSVLGVPLHPRFTFLWTCLSGIEELKLLRKWLLAAEIQREGDAIASISGSIDARVKKAMETIGLPHKLCGESIIVENDVACAFAHCLGYHNDKDAEISSAESILRAIHLLSGLEVKDKAPTFVGARMGRPEKAKRREMKPPVHLLFPVGLAGGPKRDLVVAAARGPTFLELVKRKCPSCGIFTSRTKCPSCGSETSLEKSCPRCSKTVKGRECPVCKLPARVFQKQPVNVKEMLDTSSRDLGVNRPKILKGVRGLTSETKTPEVVQKGVLRARHDLSVYKDGTTRFDATNAPLTHFKPSEIDVPLGKLRELGYSQAADGAELTDSGQLCELKLQDIVIPRSSAEYFVRVSTFIDDLLERLYGLPRYYSIEGIEDLVGHLIVGLAPHTCAGIFGRIIGFTRLNLCYAHPIWHSAKRRDCDGDEDALMLALDTLINFSHAYLPAQIGGIMDAPLLLVPVINTNEVQRQAHDLDVASAYPAEFYPKTYGNNNPRQLCSLIDTVASRLGTESQFEGFNSTIPVSNINLGNADSVYKLLKAMTDKLNKQLQLAEKIDAVDARKVAMKVLTKHFIKDIAGNLRAFSTQTFRCRACNKRYRRVPLRGKCPICGGQLGLTVYRGGIEKYLEVAQQLIEKYRLPSYYGQRIILVREEISAMFDAGKSKQLTLKSFA